MNKLFYPTGILENFINPCLLLTLSLLEIILIFSLSNQNPSSGFKNLQLDLNIRTRDNRSHPTFVASKEFWQNASAIQVEVQ